MSNEQIVAWFGALTQLAAFVAAGMAAKFAFGQMKAAQDQIKVLQDDRAENARASRLSAAFRVFAATYEVRDALEQALEAKTVAEKLSILTFPKEVIDRIEDCYPAVSQLTRSEQISFHTMVVISRRFRIDASTTYGDGVHDRIRAYLELITDLQASLTKDMGTLPRSTAIGNATS